MNWLYKTNIKQYLEDETETPETVLSAAKNIRAELSRPPLQRIFLNAPYQLEAKTQKAVDAGMDYEDVCAVFNHALDRIYDIADRERVWLGM